LKFDTADARELTFPDESFDACILQVFLTTIVLPEERIKVISEAYCVLKDDNIL